MSDAWKQLERDAAAALVGRRAGNRGTGGADVEGVPGWCIEAKYRATFTHDTLYRSEKAKRRVELRCGKKFCLITRAKGKEPLVTITLQDFAALVRGGDPREPDGTAEPLFLPLEE